MTEDKLKILLISARADYGGGPEHVYRLLIELSAKAVFFVACPCDKPYCNRYKELLGADLVIEIPHRSFQISALMKLYSFIKKNNIDLIHSHGKGAGVYSRILSAISGIQCIHTFHGIHIYRLNKLIKPFYILFEKLLAGFTKKLIAVSESESVEAVSRGICGTDKITVIHNGVVLPVEKTKGMQSSGKKLNVVTITRFDYAKNSILLIEIIDKVRTRIESKDFRFIFIGSGPEEIKIREEAERRNLTDIILFTGFTDNTFQYLVDAFCYISTSRREGLSLAVLEAMSFGIPVIATDVPGNKDVIVHGVNGFIFDLNKPESAAGFILKLKEDSELWKSISENARNEVAVKYSVQKMAEQTYSLYESLSVKKDEV